jgi:hypothetical protein
MKNDNCSIDRLREALEYNPETGDLIWKEGWRKGMVAGCVNVNSSSGNAYRSIVLDGVSRRAHRVAWAIHHGDWPKEEIDHDNGDGSDNRILNLKDAGKIGNARNRRKPRNNKSGVCGVNFDGKRRKWRVQVYEGAKRKHIGRFDDFDAAVAARKEFEKNNGYSESHGVRNKCEYVPVKRGAKKDAGVRYIKKYSRWNTRATVNGKRISIGMFDSKEEAMEAKAAVESMSVPVLHYRTRIHKKTKVADE